MYILPKHTTLTRPNHCNIVLLEMFVDMKGAQWLIEDLMTQTVVWRPANLTFNRIRKLCCRHQHDGYNLRNEYNRFPSALDLIVTHSRTNACPHLFWVHEIQRLMCLDQWIWLNCVAVKWIDISSEVWHWSDRKRPWICWLIHKIMCIYMNDCVLSNLKHGNLVTLITFLNI